jgi:nucleoid DNA-binding protein
MNNALISAYFSPLTTPGVSSKVIFEIYSCAPFHHVIGLPFLFAPPASVRRFQAGNSITLYRIIPFTQHHRLNCKGWTMTKRDLVVRIATETGLNQRDVTNVVQRSLDHIVNELAAGRGVEFRNFGVFTLKKRKKRIGRNPNNPTNTVPIPERFVVKFKPGKVMKQKVTKLNATLGK